MPNLQALLLARYLRNDLDEYPPLFREEGIDTLKIKIVNFIDEEKDNLRFYQ